MGTATRGRTWLGLLAVATVAANAACGAGGDTTTSGTTAGSTTATSTTVAPTTIAATTTTMLGGQVAGRVVFSGGDPVVGAQVALVPQPGNASTTATDGNGKYVVLSAPGTYRLTITVTGPAVATRCRSNLYHAGESVPDTGRRSVSGKVTVSNKNDPRWSVTTDTAAESVRSVTAELKDVSAGASPATADLVLGCYALSD